MGHTLRQNWNTFNEAMNQAANAMNQAVINILDHFYPEDGQHQQPPPHGQQGEEQQVAGAGQEGQQMAEAGQDDFQDEAMVEEPEIGAMMEDLEIEDAGQNVMQEEIPGAAQEQLNQPEQIQTEMEDMEAEPPLHLWSEGSHPCLPACSLCPRKPNGDPCKRVRRVVFE